MVAALGNLQIRVMLGRQPHADIRHQVDEGIVRLGQVGMHRAHHLVGGVRAGHGQDRRMRVAHHIALGPQTAGDDHFAVLVQGFADRVQRFGHGGINEAAGVDHHQVGAGVAAGNIVAFGAKAGICSESLEALGQPSDTKPILGILSAMMMALLKKTREYTTI